MKWNFKNVKRAYAGKMRSALSGAFMTDNVDPRLTAPVRRFGKSGGEKVFPPGIFL